MRRYRGIRPLHGVSDLPVRVATVGSDPRVFKHGRLWGMPVGVAARRAAVAARRSSPAGPPPAPRPEQYRTPLGSTAPRPDGNTGPAAAVASPFRLVTVQRRCTVVHAGPPQDHRAIHHDNPPHARVSELFQQYPQTRHQPLLCVALCRLHARLHRSDGLLADFRIEAGGVRAWRTPFALPVGTTLPFPSHLSLHPPLVHGHGHHHGHTNGTRTPPSIVPRVTPRSLRVKIRPYLAHFRRPCPLQFGRKTTPRPQITPGNSVIGHKLGSAGQMSR